MYACAAAREHASGASPAGRKRTRRRRVSAGIRPSSPSEERGERDERRASRAVRNNAMGVHARFTGYNSYQYLTGPKDYREFDLVEGEGMFPPYLLPLSSEIEKRAQEPAKRPS